MNCFLENLTLGNPKFLKVRGMGRIWIVQAPPGRRSSKGSVVVVEEAAVESPGSPVDDKSVSEYVPTELGGDDDAGLSVGDEIETLDADASMRGFYQTFV